MGFVMSLGMDGIDRKDEEGALSRDYRAVVNQSAQTNASRWRRPSSEQMGRMGRTTLGLKQNWPARTGLDRSAYTPTIRLIRSGRIRRRTPLWRLSVCVSVVSWPQPKKCARALLPNGLAGESGEQCANDDTRHTAHVESPPQSR